MKLKVLLLLTILFSSFTSFADHGRGRGGYGEGHGRDRGGYGRADDGADVFVSLYTLFLITASANDVHKEQYAAVKNDAVNFLAGENATDSLKSIIQKIRESDTARNSEVETNEQVALNIISMLE